MISHRLSMELVDDKKQKPVIAMDQSRTVS